MKRKIKTWPTQAAAELIAEIYSMNDTSARYIVSVHGAVFVICIHCAMTAEFLGAV